MQYSTISAVDFLVEIAGCREILDDLPMDGERYRANEAGRTSHWTELEWGGLVFPIR